MRVHKRESDPAAGLMVRVVPDGERRHRLLDAHGKDVGWIRGRALRFFGFVDDGEILGAVRRAWQAVQDVMKRELGRAHGSPPLRELRLVHDGAYEWISDGIMPIARLFRPRDGESRFAIELVIPSYANEAIAITAAQAIAREIRPFFPATA